MRGRAVYETARQSYGHGRCILNQELFIFNQIFCILPVKTGQVKSAGDIKLLFTPQSPSFFS